LDIDLVKYYSFNGKKSWAEWELAGLSVDESPNQPPWYMEAATQDAGSKSERGAPFGSLAGCGKSRICHPEPASFAGEGSAVRKDTKEKADSSPRSKIERREE
jgi:hypothetical protein